MPRRPGSRFAEFKDQHSLSIAVENIARLWQASDRVDDPADFCARGAPGRQTAGLLNDAR
ncbi:MAG: hypothetical protein H6642_07565 [Caldilineaceae bacterium]|nr:hypothetical protein [Caldilineaceae bacterium]